MPIPTGNLKAKYNFNNPACYPGSGNTVYDLSGNGITLSIQSGGTFITGDINYFQMFGDTRLDSGTNAGITTDSNITMSVWVRPNYINAPSSYGVWLSLGSDGAGTIPFIGASGGGTAGIYGPKNTLVSGGFGAGTVSTSDSNYTDESEWYFLQAVSSSSTGTSFYINGNLIGTNPTHIRPQSPSLRIGAYDSTAYNGWGDIGYVAFYNTALTESQALEEFNSLRSDFQIPVSTLDFSNPASFSGSGLTVYDLSGNNNDFYFSGSGYTYTTVTGGEVTYNSANDTLFRPTPVFNDYTFGTSPFSFHVWCKLNALGGLDLSQIWCGNFTGGSGANNNPFLFTNGYSSNNEITFTDGSSSAALGTSVIIGEWNLFSVVKPANAGVSGVQVYLNGSLLTNSSSNNTPINVSQATIAGQLESRMAVAGSAHTAASQGNVYNGTWTLGEFQFFNTAIGASQVQQFYANTENRYYPPVPAVLSFEINAADPSSYSGSGTTVYDLSPAARIGNLDTQVGGSSTWSPNFGGIFTLDGYNDIFEFSGGGVAVSQPGSISVWFRSNDPFNVGNVVSQGLYATNGWGLNLGGAYGAGGANSLQLVSHGIGYRNSGLGVTVGEWTFVTLNLNVDGTSNLFINGGLGATMSSIGMNPPQQLIRIGYDGGGVNSPEIDVAQVYMYDGAITLAEHITLFDATKTPFLPPSPVPIQNSNVGGRSFNKGING